MPSLPPTTSCAAGGHKRALVIGAETFSRILDWSDRTTCVLFGDGAGAIVLEAQDAKGTGADRGVLTSQLRSDGRYRDRLYVDGGPGSTKTTGFLRMEGRDVFRFAVGMVTDVVEQAFKATGTSAGELDWFVPHQANKRIIDASADKLGIAREKVVITVDRHGNTSAASIPLALDARGEGWAHQARRSRDDRGHRREVHLGQRAHPLVINFC
jgi:3-oxoacyl-[acyl-carrier-protein] synthase III